MICFLGSPSTPAKVPAVVVVGFSAASVAVLFVFADAAVPDVYVRAVVDFAFLVELCTAVVRCESQVRFVSVAVSLFAMRSIPFAIFVVSFVACANLPKAWKRRHPLEVLLLLLAVE